MVKSPFLACLVAAFSFACLPMAQADPASAQEHSAAHVGGDHANDDHHAGDHAHAAGDHHGEGGHHHDDLPAFAERVHKIGPVPVTNSMIMTWVVALAMILFAQMATKKMSMVPSGLQNFAEWIVESLYNFLLGIVGEEKLLNRTFWFFAGVFLMILANNWAGLFPGVGTVGHFVTDSAAAEGYGIVDNFRPYFRGGNADLNMTMAMSALFAVLWFYWAITENGLKGFLAHIFAPKGSFKGLILFLMVPIFFLVGILEVISIAIRPVALSFRLFGNIYGGEQTLEKLMGMVPSAIAFLPALPFMFMELLVGFVQALVYMLLCAVFLRLICDHGDDHAH